LINIETYLASVMAIDLTKRLHFGFQAKLNIGS